MNLCILEVNLCLDTYSKARCDGAGAESPDSAAVQQLLHVVEGLEEELFSSEARRNDAEVGPSTDGTS